jgi:hypothetical protein
LSILHLDTRNLEDRRPVNSYTGDSNPFLQDLQPNHQLHPASDMQLPRPDPEEHLPVAVDKRGFPFEFDNVDDILILGFRDSIAFATQSTEDVASFFFPTHLDEPSRAFAAEEGGGEEAEEGNDLEGDGETPDKGRFFVVVERGAATALISVT